MRLLEVAQKAYYRDRSYVAWLNGQYNYIAYTVAIANSFANKGAKKSEYPQWKDPIEKQVKRKKITKENLEYEFRKQQAEQNDWLFNRK